MVKNNKVNADKRPSKPMRLVACANQSHEIHSSLSRLLGAHAYVTESAVIAELCEDMVRASTACRDLNLGTQEYTLPEFALRVIEKAIKELQQTYDRVQENEAKQWREYENRVGDAYDHRQQYIEHNSENPAGCMCDSCQDIPF